MKTVNADSPPARAALPARRTSRPKSRKRAWLARPTARMANGVGWLMRYEIDGRINMEVSNGTADKGRWRAEDNRLCVDFEGKFPSGCSEMRADASRLYLKRGSTGEAVALTPKP